MNTMNLDIILFLCTVFHILYNMEVFRCSDIVPADPPLSLWFTTIVLCSKLNDFKVHLLFLYTMFSIEYIDLNCAHCYFEHTGHENVINQFRE